MEILYVREITENDFVDDAYTGGDMTFDLAVSMLLSNTELEDRICNGAPDQITVTIPATMWSLMRQGWQEERARAASAQAVALAPAAAAPSTSKASIKKKSKKSKK